MSGAHNWNKVYSVQQLPGGQKVLVKNNVTENEDNFPIAAAIEDLFSILREAHIATGHGKELALFKNVSRRYFNVSRQMCYYFANDCSTCMKMRSHMKKARSGHKPILTVGFGSRGQVDLVDLQSSEYGGMKWLLTYCDHGTKYAATTPVPNKQVTGIASLHSLLEFNNHLTFMYMS
jgi:hypothetical protein